jgi:hypothetical protein
MAFFHSLNILTALVMLLAPLWWSKRYLYLPRINPVSISTLFFVPVELFRTIVGPFFISGGLGSFGYQFALLMANIQSFIGLFLLVFCIRWKGTSRLAGRLPKGRFFLATELNLLSFVFFILYLLMFLVLATKTGGVLDWLADPRSSYLAKREGNGLLYAGALNFLSLSYFFLGFSTKNRRNFTLGSLIMLVAVYILGSKGLVINFFVFYLIIMWRLRQASFNRQLLVVLPLAFLVLLVNFFSRSDSVDFSSIAEYFDYYTNGARYYEDYFSGRINLFYGDVWLTSFWQYIPRALYEAKPYVYGLLNITEYYFPGGAESGNTPAFAGGVFEFADFGVLGLIGFSFFNIFPFVNALGLVYLFKQDAFVVRDRYSALQIGVSMLVFAPALGTFLPFGLFAIFLACSWIYSIAILWLRDQLHFICGRNLNARVD